MRSGLYNYTDAPEFAASLDHDPTKVWTPDEVLAIAFAHPPNFAPGTDYRVQQHQLRAARPHRREGRRQAAGQAIAGPAVRAAGHEAHRCSPPRPRTLSPSPTRTATCTAAPPLPWQTAVPTRGPGRGPSRDAPAQRRHDLNPSFASAAGGVVSTADDLATWIQALVSGRVLDAAYQRRWLDSLRPEDPSKPHGQQYGYGITQMRWGPNALYFHGGETPATTRSWATTRPTG